MVQVNSKCNATSEAEPLPLPNLDLTVLFVLGLVFMVFLTEEQQINDAYRSSEV